jgi:HEAT repeats
MDKRKIRIASPWWLACLASLLFPMLVAAQETAPPPSEEQIETIPGDWAQELLYGIWSAPDPEASRALYRAAFSAGPPLIPELEAALKDDRTVEFAAQSLAYIGGNRSLEILAKLASDKRELGLRRFLYGALGEIDTPQATDALLGAIAGSDAEPDRTVTETAILALTVRTDLSLIPKLREIKPQIRDAVVRDDIQVAMDVIEARAKYLATPEGQKPDYSIERAVRTYFTPALEPPPDAARKPPGAQPGAKAPAVRPHVTVKIESLAFSPDKTRALAQVSFEIPTAIAQYDMVLQKRLGDWTLASVWLGREEEKPPLVPAKH